MFPQISSGEVSTVMLNKLRRVIFDKNCGLKCRKSAYVSCIYFFLVYANSQIYESFVALFVLLASAVQRYEKTLIFFQV
jgi:hypothetical protein